MSVLTDPLLWAQTQFGHSELGDKRRTKRLVKLSADMASHAGKSLVKASQDDASIEGAYRFVRNDYVSVDEISKAGFFATEQIAKQRKLVLSLEDTTGLSFTHSVCRELGNVNSAGDSKFTAKGRTLYSHSSLLLDAHTEQVIGLAGQHNWHREAKVDKVQHRDREDKESYKWQRTTEALNQQFTSTNNIIHVCDRESDIYEYIDYQLSTGQRFIVRASHDRKLMSPDCRLHSLGDVIQPASCYTINIPQRGGRKARKAKIELSYSQVTIKRPNDATGSKTSTLNVVICQEVAGENKKEKLSWYLYTNEPIENAEQARELIRYYELRWRIEEFHKVWKSDGTQVEKLRMQNKANMERIAVILAFVAVRLMQLKELALNQEEAKNSSCEVFFNQQEWKIMWLKIESKPLPETAPSLYWAYYALAKLGRWYDSKRTGKSVSRLFGQGGKS